MGLIPGRKWPRDLNHSKAGALTFFIVKGFKMKTGVSLLCNFQTFNNGFHRTHVHNIVCTTTHVLDSKAMVSYHATKIPNSVLCNITAQKPESIAISVILNTLKTLYFG